LITYCGEIITSQRHGGEVYRPLNVFDLPSVPKSGHSSGEVMMDELHLDIRLLSLFLLLGTTGLRWGFLHLVLTHLDPFVI
jgi:hypothetical protein